MTQTKKIAISLLIFGFTFLPVSPFNLQVFSQESDDPLDSLFEDSDYAEITGDIEINHNLDIPSYATLVVKKGVNMTFNGGSIGVSGKLIFKGTVDDPIKIKRVTGASSYSINVINSGIIEMRNTDVSGGGSNEAPPVIIGKKSIWNTALAFGPAGAINVNKGYLIAEGCSFHDNEIAVYIGQYNVNNRVNRSKFFGNSYDVMTGAPNNYDFQYNWWGSSNGPNQDKILGNINTSNWVEREDFHDPVILIPGILGSQRVGNEWKMDPIFHTYDGLEKTFEENGYKNGKDLFVFPYEWRDSNTDNAGNLKIKIEEIKQKTHWPKVDVVAHSMGGLLARYYIESGSYQDDVDQLVALGTPQKGSPEDYLTWEAGEFSVSNYGIINEFAREFFKQEAYENNASSIFDYIRKRPITSVQELLPDYDYLFSISDNSMRVYPKFYPVNSFLDTLNSSDNLSKLDKVEVTNIIGNLVNNNSTVTSIRVGKPSIQSGSIWEHGFPENYDSIFDDHGLNKGKGDGTVPLESSSGISSDEKIEKNIAHRDLPSKAADDAFKVITGKSPEHKIDYVKIGKILLFFVFSPVDIQIKTPDNKIIGKDFANNTAINQIPDAYYSGFDTDNEFITIPNPLDGEYKIITQGTGTGGDYKIETAKITEDETSSEAKESSVEIIGTAVAGKLEEKKVEVAQDEVIIPEDKDAISPQIQIIFPENGKSYPNNQTLSLSYSASDDKTAADKIKFEAYLDDQKLDKNSIDLSLQKLGQHGIRITAQDETGNKSEKEINFSVYADIHSIIYNVNHYFDLGMIKKDTDKKLLIARIQIIDNFFDFLNSLNNDKKINTRTKTILAKTIGTVLNLEINLFISQLQNKNNFKNTDQRVKNWLIEDLGYIKIK